MIERLLNYILALVWCSIVLYAAVLTYRAYRAGDLLGVVIALFAFFILYVLYKSRHLYLES